MFLKNIRLTNFKCHDDLFIDFSAGSDSTTPVRKTTLLAGENGAGTNALLQAIALITAGSSALKSIPGLPDNFIQTKKRFAEIEAAIVTQEGVEQTLRLRLTRGQTAAQVAAGAGAGLASIDESVRSKSAQYFVAGYGSGRRLNAGGAPGSAQ